MGRRCTVPVAVAWVQKTLIKIDFKAFARHHYWMGWYFWQECEKHQHYNSNCDKCEEGTWRYIEWKRQNNGSALPMGQLRIYKMPMNGVIYKLGNDDDD